MPQKKLKPQTAMDKLLAEMINNLEALRSSNKFQSWHTSDRLLDDRRGSEDLLQAATRIGRVLTELNESENPPCAKVGYHRDGWTCTYCGEEG